MSGTAVPIAEQFSDAVQQHRAARLGMWIFLATELLLFGGIFLQAAVQTMRHPESVSQAARHLEWYMGAINAAVLLTSSLAMSTAVEATRAGRFRLARVMLLVTPLLGVAFIVIKGVEYLGDYRDHLMPFLTSQRSAYPDPAGAAWLNLYYAATGLHAIHLSVGIALLLIVRFLARRSDWIARHRVTVEISGLYWQFVDFIWMLLFAQLYLMNR
jgi:cytochrome c oxidase subunit III